MMQYTEKDIDIYTFKGIFSARIIMMGIEVGDYGKNEDDPPLGYKWGVRIKDGISDKSIVLSLRHTCGSFVRIYPKYITIVDGKRAMTDYGSYEMSWKYDGKVKKTQQECEKMLKGNLPPLSQGEVEFDSFCPVCHENPYI